MVKPYIQWPIHSISKVLQKWQNTRYDGIVVFDGPRGNGKSTLALKIAMTIPGFNIDRDLLFSRDDVIKAMATRTNSVILADEMINVTYNRDFFNEEQKKLLKILNMYRDSCNILLCCVPSFIDLDNQFRRLTKLRINIPRRGLGIIHFKNQTAYSPDVWDMKINEQIERGWLRGNTFKPKYNQLTTFKGFIRYGPLPPKQQLNYDALKQLKRGVVYKDMGTEEEVVVDDKKKDVTTPKVKEVKYYPDLFIEDIIAGKYNELTFHMKLKELGKNVARAREYVAKLIRINHNKNLLSCIKKEETKTYAIPTHIDKIEAKLRLKI